MAIKTRLRDAIWRIRGLTVRNPRTPARPRHVLFVCQGNICRSPFAAEFARRLLPADVQCRSAGFRATVNTRSPLAAVEAAERRGVSLHDHRATPLTEAMMERADVVFVMEAWHLSLLRAQFGAHRHKIMLLALYDPALRRLSAYHRCHISDPYGKSPAVFDACFARLEGTIAAWSNLAQICAA